MGPVGIAQLSGAYAQLGWIPLFTLMAMLSVNLGILNLLPNPDARRRPHLHHGARRGGPP